MKGKTHSGVDNDVVPMILPVRRVALALRNIISSGVVHLVILGVIIKLNEPKEWVSQIVVVKQRSGAIQICLDHQELN